MTPADELRLVDFLDAAAARIEELEKERAQMLDDIRWLYGQWKHDRIIMPSRDFYAEQREAEIKERYE